MNHLYIQTAFLGDLLLSIPALKQIRYWSPKSQITLVCREGYASFAKSLGICDEAIEVKKGLKKQLAEELKGRNFHTVFCPHQSYSSHQLVKAVKAEHKIGYKNLWNRSYFTKRTERKLDWPESIRQLQLVAEVSESVSLKLDAFSQKQDSIPAWAQMNLTSLGFSDAEMEKLLHRKVSGFKFREPFVCIAPGSVWPTKRWSADKYVYVATQLARKGFQVVVMGAPEERELCEKIKMQIPNSYSMAGHLSIYDSVLLLSYAKGLICNDSGAMHMGSLVGVPTLAIFGPTVQELGYKPWNPKAKVFEVKDLLCRPCGQHGTKRCPIGTHQCMSWVDEGKVLKDALALFS